MNKELLEGWAKAFENHGIVFTFSSEPANGWDANNGCEVLIDPVLVFKLRVLYSSALELDGNILFRNNIGSTIDNTYKGFQLVVE